MMASTSSADKNRMGIRLLGDSLKRRKGTKDCQDGMAEVSDSMKEHGKRTINTNLIING